MLKSFARPLLLLLALAGCGTGDNGPGPGGVSDDDAKALDEAAAKLDAEATRAPQ
jgi:hypothetical protein